MFIILLLSTFYTSCTLILFQKSIKLGLTEVLLPLVARKRSGGEFCVALDLDRKMLKVRNYPGEFAIMALIKS